MRCTNVQHGWTVAELAKTGMSRSAFAPRFSDIVGALPKAYLARWRMMVAQDALTKRCTFAIHCRDSAAGCSPILPTSLVVRYQSNASLRFPSATWHCVAPRKSPTPCKQTASSFGCRSGCVRKSASAAEYCFLLDEQLDRALLQTPRTSNAVRNIQGLVQWGNTRRRIAALCPFSACNELTSAV